MPDQATADAEREIRALESGISAAIVGRDAPFIERVFDDDFVYTGVRGEVRGKKDIVADVTSGELCFELLRFDDVRVRVLGEAALVTGRATTRGKGPMGEISGKFRYTRVYAKRQGEWRLVAFQGTPIAEK
jgi:uncharacterized protein (TIGR02246 family)